MKVAICDDNELERRKLELFLRRLEKDEQVAMEISCFDSGEAILNAHKHGESFDILFLDIYMHGLSGISVAKNLSDAGFDGSVIFCTSSVEHAVESYKLKADGYIVKPFEYKDFVEAIWRCRERFDRKCLNFRAERLDYSLPIKDIYYIDTKTHGCSIHTADKEYITYKRISEFENELTIEDGFMRIGRSFIVNLSNAKECDNDMITMNNSETIPLPIREKAKYRRIINEFLLK